MLFAASYFGIPVSTTHTITGCVIGAGAARRASAVRWGIAGNVDDRLGHHHPGLGHGRGALLLAGHKVLGWPCGCSAALWEMVPRKRTLNLHALASAST